MVQAPKDPPLELVPGIDLARCDLSMEEGQVAALVDGHSALREIAMRLTWPESDVQAIVERLQDKGVVPRPGASSERARKPNPYGGFVFPPHLMQADSVLSSDDRKRIIHFHHHLDKLTHYELLQLNRRDDVKAIKRAYRERSLEWHPDRFPRGDLGPFGPMIDAIFKRIKLAITTLSDPAARADYDEKNADFLVDEHDIAEMEAERRRRAREAFRDKEKLERRKKRNPVRKRLDKAKQYHDEALHLLEEGRLVDALRSAKLASAHDSKNEEYERLAANLAEQAAEQRIGPYLKKGTHLENLLRWDEAIECFEQAVKIAPDDGELRVRLAYNLVQGGRDPQDALPHAHKGVSLRPDDAEAHYVMGLCYEKAGMTKAAVRSHNKAVEIRPGYVEAKKRLSKLRWGF